MRFERITSEPSEGRGWARIFFKDITSVEALKTIAIVRPRHVAPYLGKNGWQISESRLPLRLEKISETDCSILLTPATVHYLEVASNYEFVFFDDNLQRIAAPIVRWYGVSYRAAKGEDSPIEVISQDAEETERPTSPPASAPMITQLGWGINLPDPHIEPSDFVLPVDLPPTDPLTPPIEKSLPATPLHPREVRRVKCLNQRCKAEIFDSMQICPFCATPR
jgi:hypothetical protein